MGVLRWRSVLDSQISGSSAQPLSRLDLEVLIALRLAVYQLGWLTRIPSRAAIHESVELVKRARKRSAAPFVNAVLRKLSARVSPGEGIPQQTIDQGSVRTLAASGAHPLWLVERWAQSYGLDSAIRICQHDQTTPVTAVRLRHPEAEEQLSAEGIELVAGALLNSARRIQHGDVAGSKAFRAGLCVIQDEASQLVAALVGHGANVLDCCAAPGGKTLAVSDLNPNSNITAIDLHPHRARLMRKLLDSHRLADKSGADDREADERRADERRAGNIRVFAADVRNLPFAAKFDRVLADVPCSGTGTLARNPEIKWRITLEDLSDLQARQISILRGAMAQVAAGGRLIYSTCSLEPEENEEVIKRALPEDGAFRIIDCADELNRLQREGELIYADPSSLTRGPYLRTLPGVHPCDGFFAALLERI
jgi:16S rRNA (cytosine967-C5)-methyltransferase